MEHQDRIKSEPQKMTPSQLKAFAFLKDYTFLFISGIRGFPNAKAEEFGSRISRFGGKVIDIKQINEKNFNETLRSVDFIIAPKTKSRSKDYAKIADKLKVPYDTLVQVFQREGQGITVLDPDWLQETLKLQRFVSFEDHLLQLPLKKENPEAEEEEKEEEENQDSYGDKLNVRFADDQLYQKATLKQQDLDSFFDRQAHYEQQQQMSAGKTTIAEETPVKQDRPYSSSKKRPRPEQSLDFDAVQNLFKPSLSERFNEVIQGSHNDQFKDPITKKRAPFNNEIIEELEQIRINYRGKGDDMKAIEYGKTIDFIQNLNVPLLDLGQLDNFPNIDEDVKLKIQNYLTKGEIDDFSKLNVQKPLWSWSQSQKPQIQIDEALQNEVMLYQEGFKSVMGVKKHKKLLTDEQRRILDFYQEFESEIPSEEAQQLFQKIQEVAFGLFEGADKVLKVVACGAMRRKDPIIKDLDILITRRDDEPVSFLLVRLVEKLEEMGIIVQQIKEMRVNSTGSEGFQGVVRLNPDSKPRRIAMHAYPRSQFPFALLYFTGPPSFMTWIKSRADRKGFSISDYQMVPQGKDTFIDEQNQPDEPFIEKEQDIFIALGLDYIPPEERAKTSEQHKEVLQTEII